MIRPWADALALAAMLGLAAPAQPGELSGRVTLSGPAPERPVFDRSSAPGCGPASADDDPLLISAEGGVQNAVVRLSGLTAPGSAAPLPPITVEQRGCSYVPRVQAALKGQPVVVVNGDALLHNVHAFDGRRGLFNVAQPPGSRPVEKSAAGAEVLRLKCDIHPWMFGWVVYSENRYSAVTAADGRFAIRGVPPGTYQLSVWHELLGTKTLEIKVTNGPLKVNVLLPGPR